MIVLEQGRAGTVVGTQFVANSAADGYTLLFTATPFAINPSLFEKLPYDTLKDFTVVSDIAETPWSWRPVPARPSIPWASWWTG